MDGGESIRDRKLVTPFENIFSAALSNFHHYFRTNGGHPVKSVWSKTGKLDGLDSLTLRPSLKAVLYVSPVEILSYLGPKTFSRCRVRPRAPS